jgi:hypothetical protein
MVQGFTSTILKHNLLDASQNQDTVAAAAQAGDIISSSGGAAWNRYGTVGNSPGFFLRIIGQTIGWQAFNASDMIAHRLLDGVQDSDTTAYVPTTGDSIKSVGGKWTGYPVGPSGAFKMSDGTNEGWSGLTFSVAQTVVSPTSGAIYFSWRAAFPCTLINVWGFQDETQIGCGFTGRKILSGTSSYVYHLPSGAVTLFSNQPTLGNAGPPLNASYNIGDTLEIVVGSGAYVSPPGSTQLGFQFDFTRP